MGDLFGEGGVGDYILDCALGFFSCFVFRTTSGDAKGLLLAVCLGILPGSS